MNGESEMKKSNKIIGLATGGFMAAALGVQAQPVPELYGHPNIPDDNPKINCVREAMYYFAGGDRVNGMLQSVFEEGASTTYLFESKNEQGETIGVVEITGPRTVIDIQPKGQNVEARQKVLYDYVVRCDPRIGPVDPAVQ